MTRSEEQVSEFLDEMGLKWIFQAPVFVYDDKNRQRVWTPDFYIPKLGMHIEVCGVDDLQYMWRKDIYKQNHIPVIFIYSFKDQKNWKNYLLAKIREIEEERHEEIMNFINRVIKF